MLDTLQFLTQIQPPRNYANIESLNRVAEYLKKRFEDMGLETSYQTYMIGDKEYKNVIATLNPHEQKRLVIGGHYDVCGDIQGADDNASAVAGVVESAKQLAKKAHELPFRIDFVCFTLEEPPYFATPQMGSYVYAQSLHQNGIELIGMINYEMIGYFSDEPNSQDFPIEFMKLIYPTTGNFIANVSNENSKEFLTKLNFQGVEKKIDSYDIVLPDMLSTITVSDHLNFWDLGYQAVMITDTAHFRNPNYHTINDTLETLDTTKMQYVIDMVVQAVCGLK
jgi:Zn-dependent M28 family amino/carboxypeptidase